MTTIKLKNGSGAPLAGDLVQGEPALDLTNKRLYTEDSSGTVIEVGTNPTSLTTGGLTVDGNISSTQGGTAASPKFTLSGSTTTGLYTPASNSLAVTTAGVRRATFKDNGDIEAYEDTGTTAKFFWDASTERLGIGNSAPTTALDVTGTVTADNISVDSGRFLTAQGAQTTGYGFNGDGDSAMYQQISNQLQFSTANTERLRIASSGDISFYEDTGTTAKLFWDASAESLGIGTSSPGVALDVNGGSTTQLRLTAADSTSASIINFGDQANVAAGRIIYSHVNDSFSFKTNNVNDRMVIDSSGNVGIGTDDPITTLTLGTGTTGLSFQSSSTTLNSGKIAVVKPVEVGNGNGHLVFETYQGGSGGGERMRIDASGNVLVGGSISGTPSIGVVLYKDSTRGIVKAATTLSTADAVAAFYNPNGKVGQIVTSGSSTSYNTSSDYRLKENVVPLTGAIDRVKQLKPSRFNFITDADTTVDGFLAHEVADVVPEAITGTKDGMRDEEYEVTPAVYEDVVIPAVLDEEGNEVEAERTEQQLVSEAVMGTRSVPDYQGIDQSKLVPLLVATIQELEARITALESN